MLIQFGVLLLGNIFDDIVRESLCVLAPLSPPEFNRCSSCSISGPLIVCLSIWLWRRKIFPNLIPSYQSGHSLNSSDLNFGEFKITRSITCVIQNTTWNIVSSFSRMFTRNFVDLVSLVDSLVRYVQVVILGLYSAVGNCQYCQFLLLQHSSQMRIVLF